MDLDTLIKATKDLPPAGSLELYAILNAKELADFRRQFDQEVVDSIYKAQAQ